MPDVFGSTWPDQTSGTGVFSQLTSENTDVATQVFMEFSRKMN